MTQITIPVDPVYIVLEIPRFEIQNREVDSGGVIQHRRIRVTRMEAIESGWARQSVQQAMADANQIWAAGDIHFSLAAARTQRFQPPGEPGTITRVDDQTFQFLINQTRGSPGRITMLLVHRFSQWDLGGRASRGTCILPSNLAPRYRGRVFAHEFGHLLGLHHDQTQVNGVFNVMQSGLAAESAVTPEQIEAARSSPLATRAVEAARAGVQAINDAGGVN